VVTIPNGYGPFETMSLIEHLFTLGGVLPLLRRIKHLIVGKPKIDSTQALTLAISPHINFFSLAAMRTLLRDAGFDAFLVGEHLMKAASPGAALRALR